MHACIHVQLTNKTFHVKTCHRENACPACYKYRHYLKYLYADVLGLSEEAEEKAIEEAEQKAESSYIKSSICDYWKGNQVGWIPCVHVQIRAFFTNFVAMKFLT